jgi:DNA-binding NarL/FixJ family response regulator
VGGSSSAAPRTPLLRLCARGMTDGEIAEQLVASARTGQQHLASIYDKTGRGIRAGAAVSPSSAASVWAN